MLKLSPVEIAAAAYGLAGYVRHQQIADKPVPPAVADLLARVEHAAAHPTVRVTGHETGTIGMTRNRIDAGRLAPENSPTAPAGNETGPTGAARSNLDAGQTTPENSPTAPELIGSGRAAAILGWQRRRVTRRHTELGGHMIDGRLVFNRELIEAIANSL
ncbi:hypothetical protein [Mycolicibacter sinensis]